MAINGWELTSKVLDPYDIRIVELILRTGRAVMVPAYRGMFERGGDPNAYLDREVILHWSKGLGRSIDYVETRLISISGGLSTLVTAWVDGQVGGWSLLSRVSKSEFFQQHVPAMLYRLR